MNEADAILLLFDVLTAEKKRRSLRVLDFYVYLRLALAPGTLDTSTANLLRNYDPSMIFLVLEHLRGEGLLEAKGSAFLLTEEGARAAANLREKYPRAVTEGLREAAKAAA